MTYAIIIPARYASTRFPGKPLALLSSKPIIQHVYENVASSGHPVYVATDDDRIARAVEKFGGKAIMTRSDHRSGTDRIYEAALNADIHADVIINVQGDEPFVSPIQIRALCECFEKYPDTRIATLARPLHADEGYELLADPNKVKVVKASTGNALYFSRSAIPYMRGTAHAEWTLSFPYLLHIGIYAYRTDTLAEITSLPPSELEKCESLEQLRWLDNGIAVRVGLTDSDNIGIDTPEDLQRAQEWLDRK